MSSVEGADQPDPAGARSDDDPSPASNRRSRWRRKSDEPEVAELDPEAAAAFVRRSAEPAPDRPGHR